MEQFEALSEELIIKEAKKVADFVDTNLQQLDGLCQEEILVQDYYLGMIRRQGILLNDIATLLEHTSHNNFSSLLILCRCLLDDFLHVFYFKLNDDEQENIRKLNADELRQMFKSVDIIMESNHKHFGGNNPYYITHQAFAELKEQFVNRPENDIFFVNKEEFRFKKLGNITKIVSGIEDFHLSKLSQRAFYFWKDTSGFVHYSNFTFKKEIYKETKSYNLSLIEETILYSYNTIELSFRYFKDLYNLTLIDDDNLSKRYGINYN